MPSYSSKVSIRLDISFVSYNALYILITSKTGFRKSNGSSGYVVVTT